MVIDYRRVDEDGLSPDYLHRCVRDEAGAEAREMGSGAVAARVAGLGRSCRGTGRDAGGAPGESFFARSCCRVPSGAPRIISIS